MAHFAKLNGDIVEKVVVVHNDVATTEQAGVDFLNNMFGTNDVWKQTSYNTQAGAHKLGGTPFRKNYAGVGFSYDSSRDAFIPPKPYNSWTLNEDTCEWDPPVEKPELTEEEKNTNKRYTWDEQIGNWLLI